MRLNVIAKKLSAAFALSVLIASCSAAPGPENNSNGGNSSIPSEIASLHITAQNINLPLNYKHVLATNGYAYVAANGLQIYKLTDPAKPVLVKTMPEAGDVRDIFYKDNYIYVADYNSGMKIIDVSSPESASIVKNLGGYAKARSVFVSNTVAFLGLDSGFYIFDLPTPTNPVFKIGSSDIKYANDMMVNGPWLYIRCSDAIYGDGAIFSSYSKIFRMNISDINNIGTIYSTSFGGNVSAMALYNNMLYTGRNSGVDVWDVSAPPALTGISSCNAYVITSTSLAVKDDYIYQGNFDNCFTIQYFDPSTHNAYQVKAFNTPGIATGISILGNYIYLTTGYGGFQTIHISSPADAAITNNQAGIGESIDVSVAGNIALVADKQNGLKIIDVADISSPSVIKSVKTDGLSTSVTGNGTLAFLGTRQGFDIIDIANPYNASIVKHLRDGGLINGVAVSGQYAYLADWSSSTLDIVDFSTASSASIIKTVLISGGLFGGDVNGVAVSGNFAYLACGNGGLQIFDITVPASASFLKKVTTPNNNAARVFIASNYVFVADNANNISVVDVSTPASASNLCTIATEGPANDAYVIGHYLYAVCGNNGLEIFDIQNISSPQKLKTISTGGYANRVTMKDNIIFVSQLDKGLVMIGQ